MLTFVEIGWICLYLGVLALVIAIEFFTIHKPFEDDEDLRKTVGISTVMFLALPLFFVIHTHPLWIWIAIMAGFGVAFGVSKPLDKWQHKQEDEKRNNDIEKRKGDILNGE